MIISRGFFLSLALSIPLTGYAQPASFPMMTLQRPMVRCPNAPFVIRNARVFDGVRMRSATDVYVTGDTIAAVGQKLKVPAGTRECSMPKTTLMPGLIDAHTHVQDAVSLNEALLMGVTTELDMFSMVDSVLMGLRRSGIADTSLTMADVRTSGTLVTAPKGHGTEYGYAIPTLSSPDSADAFVYALVQQGVDYIKLVYDDASEWGVHMPTLSSATLTAAVTAAHKYGKLAIVHIGSRQGARDALKAGADGLAHLYADSMPAAHFGDSVAMHNAFVITTFTPLLRLSDAKLGQDPAKRARDMTIVMDSLQLAELNANFKVPVRAHMPAANALANELRRAGVRVLAGTDSPNPGTAHGIAMHLELASLVDAGFEPLEALRSATSLPATTFSLKDRGRIAPGARADMMLIVGDPSLDIRTTRAIIAVWKRGRMINRNVLGRATASAPTSPPNEHRFVPGAVQPAAGAITARNYVEWSGVVDSVGWAIPTLDLFHDAAQGSGYSLRVKSVATPAVASLSGVRFKPNRTLMSPPPFLPYSQFDVWMKGDSIPAEIRLRLLDGGMVKQKLTLTSSWTQSHYTFEQFGVTPAVVVSMEFLVGPTATSQPYSFQLYNLVLR